MYVNTFPHYVNSSEIDSSSNIRCGNHKTCTQCVEKSNCKWLFDGQNCIDEQSVYSENLVIDSMLSCPQFSAVLNKEKTNESFFSIIITVSNHSESVKTYLSTSNISCNAENTTYHALFSNNNTIKCYSKIEVPNTDPASTINPLNIFYFTVNTNGVRLHFDHEINHYVTINSLSCASPSRCVTSYWNDESRKYYCKWCLDNGICQITKQQGKCDVRAIKDNLVITEPMPSIKIKGSNVGIEKFEPASAYWFDEIEMSISVTNHLFLHEHRNIIVSVAGRNCTNPGMVHNDVIKCTVSAGHVPNEDDGPIVVVYMSSTASYKLTSKKNFKFANRIMRSVKPTCGPLEGGTKIDMIGTFLIDAKNIQVKIGETVCEIVESDSSHISCLTGKSDEAAEKSFVFVFKKKSGSRFNRISTFTFEYTNSPVIKKQQNITGIASGGTKIQILGDFACVENPEINVNYQTSNTFEQCKLFDKTKILCPTPKFERKPDQIFPLTIPLRLYMDFAGRAQKFSEEKSYYVYPDPIFTNFEVNGTTSIRINGMFLRIGYRPEELTIQDRNSTETCSVLFVDDSYIICKVPPTLTVDSIEEFVITVGEFLRTVVVKKLNPINSRQFQIATVLSGISIISVFVALVFGLLFCYKIILTNSKQQTEKRYMEELRNITAGMEDKIY